MLDSSRDEKAAYLATITAITLGLYLSSLHSYLLFHSLIELTTIAIGFTLFILTWNSRRFLTNGYLIFLGIGYAFIALIDLLHTLAYKGMNIFPGFDANLPTQLWIAARSLQALTLCVALFFVGRRVDNRIVLGGYAAAVSMLVAMVYFGYFPDCYIEGQGLTPFKIKSEYVISAVLLVSLYFFYRKRKYFDNKVFFLIASSMACTVLSEISFTAYLSVYGFANLTGHFFKLAAFYLIYRAILVTGLREPFELIFRDLKQAEEMLLKSHDTLEEKIRERTVELRASEEKYRRIVDTASEGIWAVGPDTMTTFVNARLAEMLGYSTEEMIGRSVSDFLFEEDAPDHLRIVENRRQGLSDNYERRWRRKDGQTVWTLVSAVPVFDDEHQFRGSFGMLTDITERKRAEEALREAEQLWRGVFSAANDAVLLLDEQFNVLVANDAAQTVYGGELTGMNLRDLRAPETREQLSVQMEQAVKENGARWETLHLRTNGSTFPVEVSTKPFESGGRQRFVHIVRDITARKNAEQQLTQSLREKESLLREIHHRVKNNMAVVSSLLSLQAEKISDAAVRSLFEECQQRVKSMILVHEKLYQGKDLSAVNMEVYITSIISEIISLYRGDPRAITMETNIKDIKLDLESAVPCGLIINELLTNAFKYAFPDKRTGVVSVHFTKTDGTYTLTIKDNGVGLPKGFNYGEANTMGLQLVNVLANQLRGTFQIKSDTGTEAVVSFKPRGECHGKEKHTDH